MELQDFSHLIGQFLIYFGPDFFLQLVNGGFDVGSCVLLYNRLSLRFSLMSLGWLD